MAVMQLFMTGSARGDQVFIGISTPGAAMLQMMNMKVSSATAKLASKTVAQKNFLAQLSITFSVESEAFRLRQRNHPVVPTQPVAAFA
jgi:hypothetical protein